MATLIRLITITVHHKLGPIHLEHTSKVSIMEQLLLTNGVTLVCEFAQYELSNIFPNGYLNEDPFLGAIYIPDNRVFGFPSFYAGERKYLCIKSKVSPRCL